MKTGADFARQAAERQISRWVIRRCGFCNYPCAYVFYEGSVGYDAGCDCVTYNAGIEPRTWDDVAELYNLQRAPSVVAQYDAFWGFNANDPSQSASPEASR